jgi:phosphocarrier protein
VKEFAYVITDPEGIHARPAGALVKAASAFSSKVTLEKGGKEVDAKRIFGIMGLAAKKGDTILLRADGEDEESAIEQLSSFLKTNL